MFVLFSWTRWVLVYGYCLFLPDFFVCMSFGFDFDGVAMICFILGCLIVVGWFAYMWCLLMVVGQLLLLMWCYLDDYFVLVLSLFCWVVYVLPTLCGVCVCVCWF